MVSAWPRVDPSVLVSATLRVGFCRRFLLFDTFTLEERGTDCRNAEKAVLALLRRGLRFRSNFGVDNI